MPRFHKLRHNKQISGFRCAALGISSLRSDTSTGTIFSYSSITVSQWKCFTAALVSLKMESCLFEASTFIFSFIFLDSSSIRSLHVSGELMIVDASDV